MIYVCFTPESGHFSALAFMSAYDPKQTFVGLYGSATTYNRRAMKTTSMIALLLGLAVVSVLVVRRAHESHAPVARWIGSILSE